MKKRIVMMIISCVLIVAAIFYTPENVRPSVIAGAGTGENYKIEDPDDFENVLDYFMGEDSSSGTSGRGDSVSARPTVHTSGTLVEKSDVTFKQEVGTFSSSTVINRMLTIYMDGNKSYYISRGIMQTEYTDRGYDGEVLKEETKMVWNLEMLVRRNRLYLKFNVFTLAINGEAQVDFSSIIGKWVQFPDEYTNQLISLLDVANRQSLEELQTLINYGLDDLEQKGNLYSAVFSVYQENDARMTLDLSNRNSSSLSLTLNAETAKENHFLSFYNIDNTVIDIDSVRAERLTEEMVEQIFGGES